MKLEPGIPVLFGEPWDDLHWRVWCPSCRRYHYHGAGPGHRVAHCHSRESLFDDLGYYLISAATAERLAKRNG